MILTKVLPEQKRQRYRLRLSWFELRIELLKVSLYRPVDGNKVYLYGLRIGNLTPGDVSHVVELCFSVMICDVLNYVYEHSVP
jgi:hypothetical protein